MNHVAVNRAGDVFRGLLVPVWAPMAAPATSVRQERRADGALHWCFELALGRRWSLRLELAPEGADGVGLAAFLRPTGLALRAAALGRRPGDSGYRQVHRESLAGGVTPEAAEQGLYRVLAAVRRDRSVREYLDRLP